MRNPAKQNKARKNEREKNNAKSEGKDWLNDWTTSINFATNPQLKVFKYKTKAQTLYFIGPNDPRYYEKMVVKSVW